MSVSIKIDGLDKVRQMLARVSRDLQGQAVADGLNRTSLAVERRLKVSMTKELDRPTPFTLQGIGRWKARANRLNTVVYIKPTQARYLRYAVEGGTLRSNLTPVVRNVYLDQHGNLQGKRKGLEAIARLIKARQVAERYNAKRRGKGRQSGLPAGMFIGDVRGVHGLWQRDGRSLNLLVRSERNARRARRWDFYGIGERVARERLVTDMQAALREAIRRASG